MVCFYFASLLITCVYSTHCMGTAYIPHSLTHVCVVCVFCFLNVMFSYAPRRFQIGMCEKRRSEFADRGVRAHNMRLTDRKAHYIYYYTAVRAYN